MEERPIVDRRPPTDFDHVLKYPGTALRGLQRTVAEVEVTDLPLPNSYHAFYDQGREGACVGFGESIMMSILNRKKYSALWLYHEAQAVDEWENTPPEGGTSLRAGFDVLRTKGHSRFYAGHERPEELDEGIVDVNRWLTSVDQIRTYFAEMQAIGKRPVVCLGINWYDGLYEAVDKTVGRKVEKWVRSESEWGPIVGGHCICAPLCSDERQAIGWLNSWGELYPWPVWLSYRSLERLLAEQGEAAIITDR